MIAEDRKVALISVSEKLNPDIATFAQGLADLGWRILASGGTCRYLKVKNVPVEDVADLIGGGAILGHRVVTLSREIYAGLLARDRDDDLAELKSLNIPWIELVCCDFYPLQSAIDNGADLEEVIAMTDIGGPTMVRAAAKSQRIVICQPEDRSWVLEKLQIEKDINADTREHLAATAEAVVANYCLASARYRGGDQYDGMVCRLSQEALYGENPWQTDIQPGLYANLDSNDPLAVHQFKTVSGKLPSYNNFNDVNRLLLYLTKIAAVYQTNNLGVPNIAVAVKHGNACGVGVASTPEMALEKMIGGDLNAIFGGVVMTNFTLNDNLAKLLRESKVEQGKRILDCVCAPEITAEAVAELERKKTEKCRMLVDSALADLSLASLDTKTHYRFVRGGMLRQSNFTHVITGIESDDLDDYTYYDLLLAYAIGSVSNSNTITVVRSQQLIGNGVAQQDRVGASNLAIMRADREQHDLKGAVGYSDSFFPFPDGIQLLLAAGLNAILTSSGSKNDPLIEQAVAEHGGCALVMVPDKEARGFYHG